MSWSLKIRNDGSGSGDLDVSNAQLGIVRGHEKLIQDFRCAVLESVGNDDMQPEWGSYIDGGVDPSGRTIPPVIGTADARLVASAVEDDIRRIARTIQQRQLARVQSERLLYNKVTLTASEILVGVSSIRFYQAGTSLFVKVSLTTGSGSVVDLNLPVTNDDLVAS
jgi:hypothetical protein